MEYISEIMTIRDLSDYLKIPRATIYKLVKEGKIPGQKVGRHWRFSRAVLGHWLQEVAHIDEKPLDMTPQPDAKSANNEAVPVGEAIIPTTSRTVLQLSNLEELTAQTVITDSASSDVADSRDFDIMLELQKDARQSDAQIARTLNVSESTIRKRISRLISEGVLRLTAVTDPWKVGYVVHAWIAIRVDLSRIGPILQQLAAMTRVNFMAVTTGRYNIMISVTFRSPHELFKFLTIDLSGVQGLFRADTSLVLETKKRRYDILQGNAKEGKDRGGEDCPKPTRPVSSLTAYIDDRDYDIMVELQNDARQSDATIARTLNLNEGTVRRRINRLMEHRFITIAPIIQPTKVGYAVPAHIALQVDLKMIDYVLDLLSVMPRVHFLASTAGEFDVLLWATFRSPWELYDFVKKELSAVPGIVRSETLVNLEIRKMELGILQPRDAGAT